MSTTTPKKQEQQQQNRVFVNFLGGATGSVMAKSLLAPIQRVVVMQQLGDFGHMSAWQITQHIYQTEGIAKGFWRGNLTSALQRFPYGGIQLMVYDKIKNVFVSLIDGSSSSDKDTNAPESKGGKETVTKHLKGLFSKALAGGVAAGVSGTAVFPLEVIRTRLMSGDTRYRSISGTCSEIWKETNGPRNFFKGLNASLVQRVPDILINFVVFETIKFEMIERGYSQPAFVIVGGAAAALASIAFTFPLDICKRRLAMAGNTKDGKKYKGVIDCMSHIIKTDGITGLYSGAKLDCIRCVPQVILMWLFIDLTRDYLNKHY